MLAFLKTRTTAMLAVPGGTRWMVMQAVRVTTRTSNAMLIHSLCIV